MLIIQKETNFFQEEIKKLSLVKEVKRVRQVYICDAGQEMDGFRYSVDFYNTKGGKDIMYVRARLYWVKRLKSLLNYSNGSYFPKEIING